jgi:hypothetical protein
MCWTREVKLQALLTSLRWFIFFTLLLPFLEKTALGTIFRLVGRRGHFGRSGASSGILCWLIYGTLFAVILCTVRFREVCTSEKLRQLCPQLSFKERVFRDPYALQGTIWRYCEIQKWHTVCLSVASCKGSLSRIMDTIMNESGIFKV